jgi:hypothetical protein
MNCCSRDHRTANGFIDPARRNAIADRGGCRGSLASPYRDPEVAGTVLGRFFAFSQLKRSAMPNGPKVDCGGSLSPRGD